ncbi:MAG: hypothetical protein QE277_06610 [Flectobacillus sp.]|nr:hypothetical protein [Flectobacillus sp.]
MKKILSLLLLALMFLCIKHQIKAQACTDFAVIVGNWGDASLQRFDGTTGNYSNQLATGIGARINSVLQYPSPNGNLYLGGYEEVNVVNAFTGAVSFSFTGGSLSGLTEQIVVGLDGNIYVASEGTGAGSGSIARYNATTGVFIDNFISFPSYRPNGLAQDASGNWYVSTRYTPNQVLKYNSSGVLQGIVTTMGTTENGGGLKVFNNELYVVTTDSPQTVKVYSLPVTSFPATPVRTLNTGGSTFVGIAFGPDNNMYMADFYNGRVSVWNPTTGTLVRNLTNSSIGNPHGVGFTTCTPCTPPTVGTPVATQATCTGTTANNDAKIDISGVSGGDKYSYGTDTTSFTYASATSFTGATISITGLANPSSATTYYVRVYNGSGLCVKTVSVVLQPKSCVLACSSPTVGPAVATQATCTGSVANSDAKIDISGIAGGDKYSYGIDSTAFGYASATAFTGALINITGLANPSTATTYYVRVYNGADACYKTVSVVLQPNTCITCPSTTYPLCAGESYTLSTPSGMTNVQWYKNGVVIAAPTGTATSLVATTIGDYVYTGIPSGGTCKDSLCCPVKIVAGTNCCVKPTVGTPVATQSTCTGSTANSDAKIDVAGVSGGDKYSYGTDSTAFAYASATAFTGASINITGLANPSTATTYYVRVYNGADACYKTVSVVLQPKSCVIGCTSPTVGLLTATSATCNGAVANADAKLDVSGISGGDKYSYGTSTSGFTYASAIAFTGGSLTIGGLANPTSTTTYYVRVYNGTDSCFTDTQVLLQPTVCNTPCGQPNCISIGVRKN